MILTDDQLAEFEETGVLVIEDVLSAEKVQQTRDAFHKHLLTLGIDHDAVLSLKSTIPPHRIKSPVSRIFYPKWKLLDVHLDPKVSELAQELLCRTYGDATNDNFPHPFG